MQYEAPKLVAMDEVSDPVATCHNCTNGYDANWGKDYYCATGYVANTGTCRFGCQATVQISGPTNSIGQR